jgi:hypothetical protein
MGAEEKVEDYKHYLDTAKKLSESGDLEKRVEEVVNLARGYYASDLVQSTLQKEFHSDLDFEKLGKIQKKINDSHIKKRRNLTDSEVYSLMSDAVNEILPAIKYGADDKDKNMDAFQSYCSSLGQQGMQQFQQIKELIRRGQGIQAVTGIINLMIAFKSGNAERRFVDYLLPSDHLEFREKLSGYIAKKGSDHLKGAGSLNKGLLQANVDKAFRQYAQGKYDEMLKEYSTTDNTPKEEKK